MTKKKTKIDTAMDCRWLGGRLFVDASDVELWMRRWCSGDIADIFARATHSARKKHKKNEKEE